MPDNSGTRRILAAIMFADIVGYTAMMQEDEENARSLRDRHLDVIRREVSQHSGEIIQYYGDGTLSIFSNALDAILGATAIQKALRKEPTVPLRIGIHLGDVVRDEAGIYGDCVNLAARVESLSVPGAVLFSYKLMQELENHPSIKAISMGEFRFKNVRRPIEIFALDDPNIMVPKKDQLAAGKLKEPEKSIAVLPFDNMSGSDESEYFAQGVSDEIVNGLSKVAGISTISRSSCLAIKKDLEDLSSIRKRLNISHLLEGSVRTAGNTVRVSVHLVNTADGFEVWSDVIDKDLDDIFRVQDEIAQHVVQGLKVNFDPPSDTNKIVQNQTDDPAAYKLYLKGVHLLEKFIPDESRKAIDMFSEALKKDPEFSAAKCALSSSYAFLGSCGAINPLDAFNKAQRFAMQAIESNPQLAEAHLALGILKFYHFWDWDEARKSLEKARELGLSSALLHQTYGLYFAAVGKHAQGVKEMQKALGLDPLSIPVMNMLGMLYIFNEEFDKAIERYDEILELEPTFRSANQAKGIALVCQGRFEEGMVEFEHYHRLVNDPEKGLIGMVIANHMLGNKEESNEYLQRLENRYERDGGGPVEVDLGVIHCGLGNLKRGFQFLNQVYEKRFSIACLGMIWVIRCPLFSHMWKDPLYLQLMEKMELKPLDN